MAPITRRSQSGSGVGKKVHRKPRVHKDPSDNWTLLERQGRNASAEEDMMDEEPRQEPTPAAEDESINVDDAVNPLREMAERVGQEVERFAEKLDSFFSELLPDSTDRFDAAHELVLKFKGIADDTVEDLKRSHKRELAEQLKQEWSEHTRIVAASNAIRPFTNTRSSALSRKKAEQVQSLRKWQQEADLWQLFLLMLELHPFESEAQARRAEREKKLHRMGLPHRYTSEGDLWERFMEEDDLARERYEIKMWLERTADHQESDMQGIVEELEAKAGKGKGLWSSGWLHTREKIKGEKRLRSWPNGADSPLPQIRRSDNNDLLITTLDPDAPQRQQRTLEKQDTYFERAMWIACWEMLRRGRSFQDICEWFEERTEGWRAVCIGKAWDNTEPAASSAAWRHLCLLLSQSGGVSDYEAACFGLLGGSIKAVEKVCRTVDDHLYAYYNAILMQQFEQYVLAVCPDKATPQPWRRTLVDETVVDSDQGAQAISNLIARLRQKPSTKNEADRPMKIIQSYLLADEVGSLIHTVGVALSETASLQRAENLIFRHDADQITDGVQMPEVDVALDAQALRIAAHMSIVHRVLSPGHLEGNEQLEDDNVLVAYIQELRAAFKRDPIPLYAARLEVNRATAVMGEVLQDVTEPAEQKRMLSLLQDYGFDTMAVLRKQLESVMDRMFSRDYSSQYVDVPLQILEQTGEEKLHPGLRIIAGFLPDEISSDDETLVRCLQWFQLVKGGWDVTFEALALTLRCCLVTGRFACARMIVHEFPYAAVSTRKSYDTIGVSLDVLDPDTILGADRQETMTLEHLKRQCQTYFEMEQMVRAIESLYTWRAEEHKFVSKTQKPSNVPSSLKRAKEAVSEAMEPLLKAILLTPLDEREAADLAHIRLTYFPEIILAYNTVLHAAGNLITRDCLLESMDLSVTVATGKDTNSPDEDGNSVVDGNGLAECFVQAGRMRELVSSFALTSKVMMVLKAEGKAWKPRKDRVGRDLGLWEIGSDGPQDGEAVEG